MEIIIEDRVVRDYKFGEPCCDVMKALIRDNELVIINEGELYARDVGIMKYCSNCGKPVITRDK